MMKKVLITDYVWPSVEPEREVLRAAGVEVIVAPDGHEDTLVPLVSDVDGILTCFAKVTERVVRAAKNCVVIGRFGVGVDNIDVETATELGIAVTYVPDYCIDEVSDHVLALLLGWNRRILALDQSVRNVGWGSLPLTMRIMRLRGKTLGIVGFGRIGRSVAAKAKAFGMRIIFYDPHAGPQSDEKDDFIQVDFESLLRESEFISLHVPGTANNSGMMGKDEFSAMKSEAFLINCARGNLVDEDALYDALVSGDIAGAGIDVLINLSPAPDDRLFQLENLIVTPHTAFFSEASTLELETRTAQEVVRVISGNEPENWINPEVRGKSRVGI